jgi:hypothetical protein
MEGPRTIREQTRSVVSGPRNGRGDGADGVGASRDPSMHFGPLDIFIYNMGRSTLDT